MKNRRLTGSFPQIGIKSTKSLAKILNLLPSELSEISETVNCLYTLKEKTKSDGRKRILSVPDFRLKTIQKRIHVRIFKPTLQSPIAHGAMKQRCNISNAVVHSRAKILGQTDIQSCFDSVRATQIYELLCKTGCSPDVSRYLTRLTTYKGALPQGAPTSPSLLNLLLSDFDVRLAEECKVRKVAVTRYIDDISLSGDKDTVQECLQYCVSNLLSLGFTINRSKTELTPLSSRQVVTGVTVNSGTTLTKRQRKALRDEIRTVSKHGCSKKRYRSLKGRLDYLSRLHPKFASNLKKLLSDSPSPSQDS